MYTAGWHGLEIDPQGNTWRWSSGNAGMLLLNSTDRPLVTRLSFQIVTLVDRHVQLRHGDQILADLELKSGKAHPIADLTVTLSPGLNELDWVTDKPARAGSISDLRQLAFSLRNLRIRVKP